MHAGEVKNASGQRAHEDIFSAATGETILPAEKQNDKCTPARLRTTPASGHTEANSLPPAARRSCRRRIGKKNARRRAVFQYIIYCGEDRTDTKTFIPFLEKLCQKYPVNRVMADSGYESEENYHYVDGREQLSLFVKPSNREQKKKRKYKSDIGRRENMAYDEEKDIYTCAQGQKLQTVAVKIGSQRRAMSRM